MKTLIMYSIVMVITTAFGIPPLVAQSLIYHPTITSPAYATLTGRVTDNEGKGLVGATVIVEGTTRGAKTKADGKFTIAGLPCGKFQIRVSFTGFKSERINVNLKDEVNVGEVCLQVDEAISNYCFCCCFYYCGEETTPAKKSERGETPIQTVVPMLFPNPATSSVTARYDADADGYAEIEIYTEGGRSVVASKQLAVKGQNELPVDISQLPAGQYFVRISTTNRTEVVPLNIVR